MLRENQNRLYQGLERYTGKVFSARRRSGEIVSRVHSEPHLAGVVRNALIVAPYYGFSHNAPHEMDLLISAAFLHDIVRSNREDLGSQDKDKSADVAMNFFIHGNKRGSFVTKLEESEAVLRAIKGHGAPPAFFLNPQTRETVPDNLADRLHAVLFIADKLEILGATLIKRCSEYCGYERLNEGGDLREVTYQGANPTLKHPDNNLDPLMGILLENAIRIGWKNTEEFFPERVSHLVSKGFETQRLWLSGILASLDLSIEDWAQMMFDIRNPDGNNPFQLSNVKPPPASTDEAVTILTSRGKMTNGRILQAKQNPDIMQSSLEAVAYFGPQYAVPPELDRQLIESWEPQHAYAKLWREELLTLSQSL